MRKYVKTALMSMLILFMTVLSVYAEQPNTPSDTANVYDPRVLWLDMNQTTVTMLVDNQETNLTDGESINVDFDKIDDITVSIKYHFDLDLVKANHPFTSDNIPVDKTYQFELPQGLTPKSYEARDIIIMDGNESVIVGTFQLDQTGLVSLTFNERINEFDERYTELSIDFALDKTFINEEEMIQIEIPYEEEQTATYTLDFRKHHEDHDVKTGTTGFYVDETFEPTLTRPTHAKWSILTNSSNQTLKDVLITDTFSDTQTLDSISDLVVTKIKTKLDGEEIRTTIDATQLITLTEHGFELRLGDIDSAYLIEYTTKLEPGERGTKSTLTNTATITDIRGTKRLDATPIIVNWGSLNPPIKKHGALKQDASNHTINDIVVWTINYNYNQENLGTVVLTDVLSHGELNLDPSTIVIESLQFDHQGNIMSRSPVDEVGYTITSDPLNPHKTTLTILNSNGKAYDIRFESRVPLGYDGTLTNTVDDTNPLTESVSALVEVNTIPSGSKIASQGVENGIPFVEWTITINPKRLNIGTLDLVDLYNTTHLLLDESSFILTKDGNPVSREDYTIDTEYTHQSEDENDGKHGFRFTLDHAGDSTYVLKYKTTYTAHGLLEPFVSNVAKVFFYAPYTSGSQTPVTETSYITATLDGPKPGILKQGSFKYDSSRYQDDQVIEWVIHFNSSKLILKDARLTDTIDDNLSFIDYNSTQHVKLTYKEGNDTVELSEGVDYTLLWDLSSKAFKLTFIGDTLPTEYTLVYYTHAPQNNDATTNHVSLEWQGNRDETTKTLNPRSLTVSKTNHVRTVDHERFIDWVITFNSEKNIIKNFELNDIMTHGEFSVVGAIRLYTVIDNEDVEVFENQYDVHYHDSDDETYVGPGFTLSMNQTKPVMYRVKYTTKLSPLQELYDTINTLSYTYQGHVENKVVDSVVSKRTLKLDKSAITIHNKDSQTKPREIEWEVILNEDLVNLVNAVFSDTVNVDQKLLPSTIQVERFNGLVYEDITDLLSITTTNTNFTFNVPNGPAKYRVRYHSEILEYPYRIYEGYESLKGYVNLAHLSINPGEVFEVSDHAAIVYYPDTQSNTPEKTGIQNVESDLIEWTAIINPDRQPIKNGSIVDRLGNPNTTSNHDYVPNTIVIEMLLPNGDTLPVDSTNYALTFSEGTLHSFTLVFKDYALDDGTTLYKEYANQINHTYKVSYKTELDAHVKGVHKILNHIGVYGDTDYSWNESTSEEVRIEKWYIGTASQGFKIPLDILKNDSLSSKPIEDVEFLLQRVSGETNVVTNTYAKLITDEQGTITTEVRAGRYFIKEIKTPVGYEPLPSDLDIKIIIERDANGLTKVVLDDPTWSSNTPYLSFIDGTLILINERVRGTLTATKIWNHDLAPLADTTPTIWMQLWQTDSNGTFEPVPNTPLKKLTSGVTEVSWDSILLYDESVNPYSFTVKEVDQDGNEWVPNGYTSSVQGLTITNTYTLDETLSIPVEKTWDDFNNKLNTRPESITVRALNAKTDEVLGTLELTAPTWSESFTGLPKYDKAGQEIAYTLSEEVPVGYTLTLDGNMERFILTNTYTNRTLIKGVKAWNDDANRDGIRPDTIEVNLLVTYTHNGETTWHEIDSQTIAADQNGHWSFEFINLPLGDPLSPFIYIVEETPIPGYTTSITKDETTGDFIITNTHDLETIDVSVEKVWDDANDYDHLRKDVTVRLLEDGIFKGQTLTLSEENSWKGAFEALDKYKSGSIQTEIQYTIEEVQLDPYTSIITGDMADGFTITNTHFPDKTFIEVSKTWDDDFNRDGLRTDVIVKLYADGVDTQKQITLTEANNWTALFEDLFLYREGGLKERIEYTVEELEIDGYTSVITYDDEHHITLINTHTPRVRTIEVQKVWIDDENLLGTRTSVVIELLANGTTTGKTLILDEDTQWIGQFTDLIMYEDGTVIEYTIQEMTVPKYRTAITGNQDTGFVVTNILNEQKPSIDPEKPINPLTPLDPDTPVDPSTPTNPESPTQPETIPNLGTLIQNNSYALVIVGVLLVLSSLRKHRKS